MQSLCHVRLCGRQGPNLDFLCLCSSSRGRGSAAVTLPLGEGFAPGSSCSFLTHSKSFGKQESPALFQNQRVVQVRNIETYCSDEITSYIILKSVGLLQLFLSGSCLGFFFQFFFQQTSESFLVFSILIHIRQEIEKLVKRKYKTQLRSLGPKLSSSGFPVCTEHYG